MNSPEEPFTLRQMAPRRRRAGLVVSLAVGALLVLVGGGVAAYAALRPSSASTATRAARPTSAPVSSTNAPPTEAVSPTAVATSTAAASTTPAWMPCTIDGAGGTRKCESSSADSCDWAEYSRLWSTGTVDGVLDAFIENRELIDPIRLKDCPQFLPVWQKSLTGFDEGVKLVPGEVKPGRYQTTAHLTGGRVSDCYWERSRGGKIVANDFVSGSPMVTVTVREGDDAFTSRGCGDWVRAA